MRYKYTEADIEAFIQKALQEKKSCQFTFKNGHWPFSLNVINTYLVGRRQPKSDVLKKLISQYKEDTDARYSSYHDRVSDEKSLEIVQARLAGQTLHEISIRTGVSQQTLVEILKRPRTATSKFTFPIKKGRITQGRSKPSVTKNIKIYSRMNVRDKLDIDIAELKYRVEEYGADHIYNIGWERRLEILQKKAEHYDREVAAGYKHPTTHRWVKKPLE